MLTLRVNNRTSLRSVTEDDAEALFALVDRNRAFLREWLPWLDSNESLSDTFSFIQSSRRREADGAALVALIDYNGVPCGVAGFNWVDPANRCCEIGYWLSEDHQGKGIVTACCRGLVRHAFETLDLNRITISVASGNARSLVIPKRLGFRQEGVLREAEWLYDHFVDHVLFTLIRREYENDTDTSQQ